MISNRAIRLILVTCFALGLIPAAGQAQSQEEVYVKERHGDCEVRCIGTEDSTPCQLYQLLRDQSGNPVAEINLINLPQGRTAVANGTIVTPLETLLTKQVTWQVGDHAARMIPFYFCSRAGCFARVSFDENQINQMRIGNTATVTIAPVAAPDTTVVLAVSLAGFTKGFAALSQSNANTVE